jgi:hypothetical protein
MFARGVVFAVALALSLMGTAQATPVNFDLTGSSSLSLQESWTVIVKTELFGNFSTDLNHNRSTTASSLAGPLVSDIDLGGESIALSSLRLEVNPPMQGPGKSGPVKIWETGRRQAFELPSGLVSPLIPNGIGSWIFGGDAFTSVDLELDLRLSIPGVAVYSDPFDVGPFKFTLADVETVAGALDVDGLDAAISLQLLFGSVQTSEAVSTTTGLPAGINEVQVTRNGSGTFNFGWGSNFQTSGTAIIPEPSTGLLLGLGLAGLGVGRKATGAGYPEKPDSSPLPLQRQ